MFLRKMFRFIVVLFFAFINIQLVHATDNKPFITLEVIRAFDKRLPVLSDDDIKESLDEAKRIIYCKLSDDVEVNFHDNGTISLEELFGNADYKKGNFYKEWKYDVNNPPNFDSPGYKSQIIKFLKKWKLDAQKEFCPEKTITSYEDFYKVLCETYKTKIEWLKSLKINKKENIFIQSTVPYQSYVEWRSFMRDQNKYDIIFTNTLVIYDLFSDPYPHTVFKHAKAGGGAFYSPKRKALYETAIVVNTLETHCNIAGISKIDDTLSKSLRNKSLGGFMLAHEYGHAVYCIPDMYDHGDTCLMNTSLSNMENIAGYQALVSDLSMCKKCKYWIDATKLMDTARNDYNKSEFEKSGDKYYQAAVSLDEKEGKYYKDYIINIYEKALDGYRKINNKEKMAKCREAISSLRQRYLN